ncbi:MAG: ATP synthase F0 subunit B [Crocinitomicaceae bacterium]|nr:ATP synthase F0 subunit B [Crocinitomicaceae bacterium]
MELVTPGLGLIFWTSVVFLLLIFLLKKFAWSPILKAVDDRNKSIDEALSSAEKAKVEMEQLSANNEKIIQEARIERDSIIKEARAVKENIISEAKSKASSEAEKIILSAKEQITNEKMKAMVELKNEIADISIQMAEKIIKSELKDVKSQKKLIEKTLKNQTN